MQPVRIEQAQCTVEFSKINPREHLFREFDVGVTGEDDDIAPALAEGLEVRGPAGIHVDEIKAIERWGYFQRARWAAFDVSPGAPRYVDAGAREPVNVEFLQARVTKSRCVGSAVFLDDLKLQLRPTADFIELNGAGGRHEPTCNSRCSAAARSLAGNWL